MKIKALEELTEEQLEKQESAIKKEMENALCWIETRKATIRRKEDPVFVGYDESEELSKMSHTRLVHFKYSFLHVKYKVLETHVSDLKLVRMCLNKLKNRGE